MQYFVSFLEGIITFLSPCLLPILPLYISYFAGGKQRSTRKTICNACGFILGFTIMFVLMGVLAGVLGRLLNRHQILLNLITGTIVILFGLQYLDVLHFSFHGYTKQREVKDMNFFSSLLFGIVFSIGWTPCVGTFLGSALAMAAQTSHIWQAAGLLTVYSLGLGLPFLLSAVLIDTLKTTFTWIKQHYDIINRICGIFLVIVGILMMTGLLQKMIGILA